MKTCWQYFLDGMMKSVITIASSFVFLGYVGSSGAVGIVPHDLSVGDTYQLIFVTEGGITAGGGKTFADYDNFVDAEANRSGSFFEGLAADWSAIVSLDGQWARNHVSFATSPIYLVTSLSAAPIRVENNANGLWGGPDNARIFAPINYNQFGSEMNSLVWTGSYQGGDDYAQGMDSGSPQVGESWSTGTEWIFNYPLYLVNGYRGNQQPASSVLPLYALSSELTVSAVPVPAAVWLFASGLLGLIGVSQKAA